MSFQAVGSCVTAQVPLLLSSSGVLETSEPIASVAYWVSTVSGLVRVSLWAGIPATATAPPTVLFVTSSNPNGESETLGVPTVVPGGAAGNVGVFNMAVGDILYLSIVVTPGQSFASLMQYAITIEAL